MRLSNKLFLGTVLFVMVVVIMHFIALAYMYEKGWYSEKRKLNETAHFYPRNVKVVCIEYCKDVNFYRGDTLKYSVYKGKDFFKAQMKGDTLVLKGDTTVIDTVFVKGKMVRIDTVNHYFDNNLEIFLTGNEQIEGVGSTFEFHALREYESINVLLNSTSFRTISHKVDNKVYRPLRVKSLNVEARNNSSVTLGFNDQVDSMNISLEDFCDFSGRRAYLNSGIIYYSDYSGIDINGYQLKTIKLEYRKAENTYKRRDDYNHGIISD